jgi:hypothetical protein
MQLPLARRVATVNDLLQGRWLQKPERDLMDSYFCWQPVAKHPLRMTGINSRRPPSCPLTISIHLG